MQEEKQLPAWINEKGRINEVMLCRELLSDGVLKYSNGNFYSSEGLFDENMLRSAIYQSICDYVETDVWAKVTKLINVMRMEAESFDSFEAAEDRIHVFNGTLFLNGCFTENREFCHYRLPIIYDREAPEPVLWKKFLSELLYEDDIPTLQEYMGYLLIPSTRAQKMLMIIGKGGEGKSRIGRVLREILGTAMNTGSIAKVEMNQFARADLEGKFLLLDDDLKLEALPQTNYIKSIITAEVPMDLERKCEQSYQGKLFVRFLGLGNGSLQSLNDHSLGFFRRQIILTTKDRPRDRVDDPFLAEKLIAEKKGIFNWCFEGLQRLCANNYIFTLSNRSKINLNNMMKDSVNVSDFMLSTGYFAKDPNAGVSSRELYAVYRVWCDDNAVEPMKMKPFTSYLKTYQDRYGLVYSKNVIEGSRSIRGFKGINTLISVNPESRFAH